MRKLIIRLVYTIAVFIVSVVVFESLLNKESTDVTTDMEAASYPVVTMQTAGAGVNELHGLKSEQDIRHFRTVITPIRDDRTVRFTVEPWSCEITGLSYEVRTIDGSRLIENSTVEDDEMTVDEDGTIHAEVALQNLINSGSEYMLVILAADGNGREIRYYTRIIEESDDTIDTVKQELAFAKQFHDDAIAKNRKILDQCLETDSSVDNDNYYHVTMKSTTLEGMYGDLIPTEVLAPVTEILDISGSTVMLRMDYILSVEVDGVTTWYDCTERFCERMGTDRVYMLDYDRTMQQIFAPRNEKIYGSNALSLGITGDVQLKESSGGIAFAFVDDRRLYGCVPGSGQISTIFSFGSEDSTDLREIYRDYDIRILNVDETGNVDFVVYGYMNRGTHEGEIGVAVYEYNNEYRTIDEEVFLPYTGSAELLKSQVDRLSYYNKKNLMIILIDDTIYEVDLTNRKIDVLWDELRQGSYEISEDGQMFALSSGEADSSGLTGELTLFNFQTMKQDTITAGSGEKVVPLGFMGTDLIYGLVRDEDLEISASGEKIIPMYTVRIVDTSLNVLEEYTSDGYYVTGCTVDDNQITLSRAVRNAATGEYTEASSDQIMSNKEDTSGSNGLTSVLTKDWQTVQEITTHNFSGRNLTYIEPKYVQHEDSRTLELPATADDAAADGGEAGEDAGTAEAGASEDLFVYDLYGVSGFHTDPAEAVKLADSRSGAVTDNSGRYVFRKFGRLASNQIMAIEAAADTGEGSVAVCLDSIFTFENVKTDVSSKLAAGESVPDIIEETIPDSKAYNLTGCTLDSVLYYVNVEKPVLVLYNNARAAVLIVGYNDSIVVIMDPETEALERVPRETAEELYFGSGCSYIAYLVKSED